MSNKFLILALTSSLFTLAACNHSCPNNGSSNYVEVNGTASKEVAPDVFYLSITLDESDFKPQKTVESLEKQLIDTLRKFNIDPDKALTISNLTSNYDWYWWRKRTKPVTRKSYELKLDNIRAIENICQSLEKGGISNLYFSKVDYSKIDSLRNEVKAEAVKNAKQNAQVLAVSVDQHIGKPVLIQEQTPVNYGYGRNMYYNDMAMAKEVAYESEAPDYNIDFKKITIQYTVLARFEIK